MCAELLKEDHGGVQGNLLLRSLLKAVEPILSMDQYSTKYMSNSKQVQTQERRELTELGCLVLFQR